MGTVLEEIGALLRTKPTSAATSAEIAAWYDRKAVLFDQIAADPATSEDQAARASAAAHAAREHAIRLLGTRHDVPAA